MKRLEVMQQVVECTDCHLHEQCTAPVFMSGQTPTLIAVVGEAPGGQEDDQGAPFVGPAGEMMRQVLEGAGIDPQTVVFINTVSCFPHGTPTWDHVNACADNKRAQLDLAAPHFVLAVGKVALKAEKRYVDIKHGRGRPWRDDTGRIWFATYHPAAALRNSNYEQAMEDDVATFKAMVDACQVNPDAWMLVSPDSCSGCTSTEIVWYEDCGFPWCETHIPEHATAARAAWEAVGVPKVGTTRSTA